MLDPSYIAARRVLLDALEALIAHRDQLVLVGAQAVYLHTGPSELRVPLMTTDADLALNVPGLLASPEIVSRMRAAGFHTEDNPGHWVTKDGLATDLMVVPHQSGRTSPTARAAHLEHHGKEAARIARGLEASLVDNSVREITALDPSDARRVPVRVAGPAALLVAKTVKVIERSAQSEKQANRLHAKDALDMFRILQAVEAEELAEGFSRHRCAEQAAAVSGEARQHLKEQATDPDATFPSLAAQAARGDETVAMSFTLLVRELLSVLGPLE